MKKSPLLLICGVLIFSISFARQAKYKRYENRVQGGVCSASILLYDDGMYVREHGCEGSSYISFGNYITKKDSLKFTPADNKTYNVIKKAVAIQKPSDSISVTILDRNDVNITNQLLILFFSSENGISILANNDSGTKKIVHKAVGGEIVLRTLNRLFHQRFNFPTDSANYFVITLNLPRECVYNGSKWDDAGAFTLLKRSEKLINTDPTAYHNNEYELKKD